MYEYAALVIALTLINTIVCASILCEQAYDNMEEVNTTFKLHRAKSEYQQNFQGKSFFSSKK